jgi:membrane protease YdiL (CAAX protease family)
MRKRKSRVREIVGRRIIASHDRKAIIGSQERAYLLAVAPVAALVSIFALFPRMGNWFRLGVYAVAALFTFVTVRLLKRRDKLGIMPADFIDTFRFSAGGKFFTDVLTAGLSLFVVSYFVFSILFGKSLYPVIPLWYLPLFFIIRFGVDLVEESLFRGIVQRELQYSADLSPAISIGASAVAFGAYFAFSTPLIPIRLPNFLLGTLIGATTGYLYYRNGKAAVPVLARAVYETLFLAVLA